MQSIRRKLGSPLEIVAAISMLLILLAFLFVLISSLFTHQLDLDLGWMALFVGSTWLSITAINSSSAKQKSRDGLNVTMEATLISFGLAWISKSKSTILFGFFLLSTLLCFLFWSRSTIGQMIQEYRSKQNRT
jgi:hypothetical protein